MKLEILKENFRKAINICERITRKSTSLPVLQNVLVKAEGNFLELITTNLEASVKCWVLAKIIKTGQVVVPATFLANLVNLIKFEKIDFFEEGGNLFLVLPDQEVQIQGQSVGDFPVIPEVKGNDIWVVSTKNTAEALLQVIDVPSTSQIRPEISGIYFSLKKGKLRLVATDSFRLAEKIINLETAGQKEDSFIIPQLVGRELLNILSQEDGQLNIRFDENQVLFELISEETKHPKIQLIGRLIEGEYPNYQEIIPQKHTTKIQIDKEEFSNQIKKAGLFSGRASSIKLIILPAEKRIRVFSQSAELGKNEASVACRAEGKEAEVVFNYRFLLDGLNNIRGSEVILGLGGEAGPGVLKPVGDDSYIYILMPIKSQ